MEKFGVVLDDEKTKTASKQANCPMCGLALEDREGQPYCPTHGFEPFEKKPEQPST